jgi:hypothetical protein
MGKGPGMVAPAWNSSYSGGEVGENQDSRPGWAKG